MYNFLLIDTRSPVVPTNTVGVEVTDPKIAAMCDRGNIDPQHGCDSGHFAPPVGEHDAREGLPPFPGYRAAVHAATQCPLPASGATLATIRPDLDSVAAMAVLALRKAGQGIALAGTDVVCRIESVIRADAFVAGEWRPMPLPTAEQPWPAGPRPGPEQPASVDSTRELAAINAVCQDRALPLAFRVACVAAWVLGGESSTHEQRVTAYVATHGGGDHDYLADRIREVTIAARGKADADRLDTAAALSDGRIAAGLVSCPRCGGENRLHDRGDAECTACGWDSPAIAMVRGNHPGATGIGYCLAPVVVAINADFRWPSGGASKKHTIAFYASPGVGRMGALAAALNREEAAGLADCLDLEATSAGAFPGPFAEGGIPALVRRGDAAAALTALADIDPAAPHHGCSAEQIVEVRDRIRDLLSERPSGGWGGNFTSGILGSPQGRASVIPDERVVELVRAA